MTSCMTDRRFASIFHHLMLPLINQSTMETTKDSKQQDMSELAHIVGSVALGDAVIPPPPSGELLRDASQGTMGSPDLRTMPAEIAAQALEEVGLVLEFSSVVKVFATLQPPDFDTPWQTKGIQKASGSGVAILDEENTPRLLTSAHVVADQTFLQVQRAGMETPDKYVATVYAVCNDADLALLHVEDSAFWKGIKPAPLIQRMPEMRSIVLVAGFPIGGGELSITEGVVSRTEGQTYVHTRRKLLAITVDAAINEGNSGGPVFNTQGELVGIAFQGMQGASNIGHIIPPSVIQHFLNGVAKEGPEGYKGFPGSGLETQDLDNPYLRARQKVPEDVRGVRVTRVLLGQTCEGVLEPGDIITHINDQNVANNGTVSYGKYGRVDIDIVFSMMQIGSPIDLRIVRDGIPSTVTVIAKPFQQLVPLQFYYKRPPYFIYCGMVFQILSLGYINKSAAGALNPIYVSLYYTGLQREDWKRAIVLSQVLSDPVNIGYEDLVCEKILKVNGENVVDLADLISKIESTTKPTVCLQCCCDQVIILPSPSHPDAKAANERISQNYCLSSDRYVETE